MLMYCFEVGSSADCSVWGVTFLQVLEEAARVFGPSGRNTASRNDADGMTYTLSVLKEALRR